MPVRLRITLLFSVLVLFILSIVCTGIYFFSYKARINTIKTRLTNRAITTARLLSQREIFDQVLVRKIDSSTTITLKNKTVQAYDYQNNKIYNYSDLPGDTLNIDAETLNEARIKGKHYFEIGDKEALAYHYTDPGSRLVVVSAGEDEEGRQNLHGLLKILLASFIIGNVFVWVVGYFFSKGLLTPIRKISKEVAEISAQNLARRIHTRDTEDEWQQLSHTLNDLLNRLQESFELQRRFISNASHELSTPLTAISNQLEVSLQRERDAAEYKKVMHSIYQDVQHMNKLTQILLEVAKASGDPGGLEIDRIRMDEVVLRSPAEVVKASAAYTVKLHFKNVPEDEEKLLIFGNEALLLTAFRNIVINACKYSPDHAAFVQLEVHPAYLLITVADKGVGIPKTELDNIFQPFYRVAENRFAGGFGLGLSLAERIIKIHKGSIDVVSEPGEGTTFSIRLPAAERISSKS